MRCGKLRAANASSNTKASAFRGRLLYSAIRMTRDPHHTFYFGLEDGTVIDAGVGGNSARWINHSCAPNCIAREYKGRITIEALHDIDAGEELFYDYALAIDARYTKQLRRAYACRCGAPQCRQTMLAPKKRA